MLFLFLSLSDSTAIVSSFLWMWNFFLSFFLSLLLLITYKRNEITVFTKCYFLNAPCLVQIPAHIQSKAIHAHTHTLTHKYTYWKRPMRKYVQTDTQNNSYAHTHVSNKIPKNSVTMFSIQHYFKFQCLFIMGFC